MWRIPPYHGPPWTGVKIATLAPNARRSPAKGGEGSLGCFRSSGSTNSQRRGIGIGRPRFGCLKGAVDCDQQPFTPRVEQARKRPVGGWVRPGKKRLACSEGLLRRRMESCFIVVLPAEQSRLRWESGGPGNIDSRAGELAESRELERGQESIQLGSSGRCRHPEASWKSELWYAKMVNLEGVGPPRGSALSRASSSGQHPTKRLPEEPDIPRLPERESPPGQSRVVFRVAPLPTSSWTRLRFALPTAAVHLVGVGEPFDWERGAFLVGGSRALWPRRLRNGWRLFYFFFLVSHPT